MGKHLIKIETSKVLEYKKMMENALPAVQNIVSSFFVMEVKPDLSEIERITLTIHQNNLTDNQTHQLLDEYLRGKLADKTENPQIAGVKISRDKFMDMMELPDCRELIGYFMQLKTAMLYKGVETLRLVYFEIKENTVTIKESTEKELTQMYSIYANSDNVFEIYNTCKNVADNLNALEKNLKTNFYERGKANEFLPFLTIKNYLWDVDLEFIKRLNR